MMTYIKVVDVVIQNMYQLGKKDKCMQVKQHKRQSECVANNGVLLMINV